MKRVCKKRIFVIFSIIMVSFVMLSFFASNVSAEINPDTNTGMEIFAKALNDILGFIGESAMNSIFSGFATLLGTLAIVLYLLVALIFSTGTGSIFPTPDNIIFNRMAILDVNFFNPNNDSIIGMAGSVVQNLYNSFHSIAISVFVIAAMIVGIKMALSTVASAKAQAKSALVNWLTGIIILFLMRLIIAVIFEANEYIVWKISDASSEVTFEINVFDAIPVLGKTLKNLVNGIASMFTGGKDNGIGQVSVSGYSGMLSMFALNAWGGDIFSAILLFVLFGQTITLFVAYAKRLMFSIILGVVAPLVVAIDTINKSLKGQSTILSNWFKEFIGTVFIQVFHSLLMLVTMQLIGSMTSGVSRNSPFVGIATIILTSGIVKFEKLYKQIFGLSDGMLGGLKGQAGKIMQTAAGLKAAGGAIGDNVKKTKAAYSARKDAVASKEKALQNLGRTKFERSAETFQAAISTMQNSSERSSFIQRARNDFNDAVASGWGSRDGEREKMEQYKALLDKAENGEYISPLSGQNQIAQHLSMTGSQSLGGEIQPSSVVNSQNANGENKQTPASSGELKEASKEFAQEISKLVKELSNVSRKNDSVEVASKKVEEADKRIRQANKDLNSGVLATLMSPVNVGAGIGFGLGAGEDMAGTALKGGILTERLDAATEKFGSKLGDKASDAVYQTMSEAIKKFDKNSNVGDI